MTSIKYAVALSAALALSSLALNLTPAAAANSAMADCNKTWTDKKATLGTTYQDFLKSCLKAAGGAATDAKATDAKAMDAKATDVKAADTKTTTDTAAKTKMTTAAAPAAATDAVADPLAAAKKACGKEWKAAKAADTAGTLKKKDFVAACLAKAPAAPAAAAVVAPAKVLAPAATPAKVDAKATDAKAMDAKATDAADVVPPEPAKDVKDAAVKATDANGKPRTAGQLAMDKRIKECGVEWHKAKGADGLVNGLKWPQYWSQCNKKMKAAGG